MYFSRSLALKLEESSPKISFGTLNLLLLLAAQFLIGARQRFGDLKLHNLLAARIVGRFLFHGKLLARSLLLLRGLLERLARIRFLLLL